VLGALGGGIVPLGPATGGCGVDEPAPAANATGLDCAAGLADADAAVVAPVAPTLGEVLSAAPGTTHTTDLLTPSIDALTR
jgi:hypothetical protein